MNKTNNTFFFGMLLFLGVSMYLGFIVEDLEKELKEAKVKADKYEFQFKTCLKVYQGR